MKKVLSVIIALLIAGLCCICAAPAEGVPEGTASVRESAGPTGCSFAVTYDRFMDQFWAIIEEESPYARASLTEDNWATLADLEAAAGQEIPIPDGTRLYQKSFRLSDHQIVFLLTVLTDEEDYIISFSYSAPTTATIRNWGQNEETTSMLTLNYYILYPGTCMAVLGAQPLASCKTKINALINDAADGLLPVNDQEEYYVTEEFMEYAISTDENHIPIFRFTAAVNDIVPEPVAEPTPEPVAEITPEPTAEPAPEPTAEPTAEPTTEPTPELTEEPTPEPTAEPTPEPTPEPTEEPTPEPTAEPTPEPTPEPTEEPTLEPTAELTPEPVAPETPQANAQGTGEEPEILYVTKTNKSANIREKPDKNSALMGRIPGKMWTTYILEITTGEDGRTWYKVMSLDGIIGYVRSDFFHKLEPYEGKK